MSKVKSLYKGRDHTGYYQWLLENVNTIVNDRSYLLLLRTLRDFEFYWVVPNDDNRIADAMELRVEYDCLDLSGMKPSLLEVLIALSIRCEDMEIADCDDGECHPYEREYWFWLLITNLGLDKFDDENYYILDGPDKIDEILQKFVDRKYEKNGEGGLFPLKNVQKDQRKIEIWYQMSAYMVENFFINE